MSRAGKECPGGSGRAQGLGMLHGGLRAARCGVQGAGVWGAQAASAQQLQVRRGFAGSAASLGGWL